MENLESQMFMAQRACFMGLVKALYEANVLPIGAVSATISNTYDFSVGAHGREKNPLVEAMIDSLEAIEEALRVSRPPLPGPADE